MLDQIDMTPVLIELISLKESFKHLKTNLMDILKTKHAVDLGLCCAATMENQRLGILEFRETYFSQFGKV